MQSIINIIRRTEVPTRLLVICFILAIISSLFAIIPAQFFGFIITAASGNADTQTIGQVIQNNSNITSSYQLAFVGVIFFLISTIVFTLLRNFFCYFATITCERIIVDIRKKMYSKLMGLNFKEFLNKPKGQIIHSIMNDTQRLENIFDRPFYTLFSDFFDLIWISIFLIIFQPTVLIILVCTIPFLYIASIKTAKVQRAAAKKIQSSDTNLTTKVEQTLSGFETIKVYNAEKFEQKLFGEEAEKSFKSRKESAKSLSIYFPIEGLIRLIGIVIIVCYTIVQIENSLLQIGMIAVFADYANKFYSPIKNFAHYFQTIQKGIVACTRIDEFFEMDDEIIDPTLLPVEMESNSFEIKNLSLSLNNQDLIKNISLKCSSGELNLIKGISGSGKTSLLRALMGLYDVEDGTVFIHGNDINSLNKKELRKRISYAGQNVFLHNDTIVNNLLYPAQFLEENLIENLLKKLNLHYKALNEITGEEGKNLSGGEKARLAFARAVIKKCDILILDEVTSSLDLKNELAVIDVLAEMKKQNITIFFVTHSNNPKLIEIADNIFSLEN